MKSEAFMRAVGDIDDALILEAESYRRRGVPVWVRWAGAAAACLVCAAGILAAWPQMKNASDNAEMAAPEAVGDALYDRYYAADEECAQPESTAASASGKPAETAAPEALDTGAGHYVRERTFWFREGDAWRKTKQPYPDGLPAMREIVSDYLAAAGAEVRCTAARHETVGEKDEILPGGIIQHTEGVKTWYITLDGDVSREILMGLTNTVLDSAANSSLYQVHITMPGGTFGPTGAFE